MPVLRLSIVTHLRFCYGRHYSVFYPSRRYKIPMGTPSVAAAASSSRFVEHITQKHLMRYVSRCAANSQVFNADLKLLMLSVGSRRKSGNEYRDHQTRDGVISSTTNTCCDGVVASLSSLMMWNLQSYPTTVLNERMWHFRGSKHTLTHDTYFQGVRTPNPLGSMPLHGSTCATTSAIS